MHSREGVLLTADLNANETSVGNRSSFSLSQLMNSVEGPLLAARKWVDQAVCYFLRSNNDKCHRHIFVHDSERVSIVIDSDHAYRSCCFYPVSESPVRGGLSSSFSGPAICEVSRTQTAQKDETHVKTRRVQQDGTW